MYKYVSNKSHKAPTFISITDLDWKVFRIGLRWRTCAACSWRVASRAAGQMSDVIERAFAQLPATVVVHGQNGSRLSVTSDNVAVHGTTSLLERKRRRRGHDEPVLGVWIDGYGSLVIG